MSSQEKTVAEFFAGIGLMRLGLEQAGWNTIWANDLDPDKEVMYRHHFEDAHDHFVLQDVHLIDPTSIPSVTLATASFPCTDLSFSERPQTKL
jgi:DNA (cytosine-5)-methyltransferase 1